MIKKLHKLGVAFLLAAFSTLQINAQQGPTHYTFTGSDQSWIKGYGTGTVAHDPSEGVSADGALTLERLGNGNANIRRGQGGDDDFIVIDRAVYSYIKIVYKNETAAASFRVAGTSRDAGTTGVGTNFTAIVHSGIESLSSTFTTAYIDITSIPAGQEITRLDILVRENQTSDPSGSKMIFDEIEFLESIPQSFSEFIKNPGLEDPEGIPFFTGSDDFITRSLSTEDPHTGTQGLKYVVNTSSGANPVDKTTWTFSSYEKTYDDVYLAGATLEVKVWVKTNRASTIKISGRVKTTLSGADTATKPIATTETTNTAMGWEEITITMTAGENFDGVTFWFAFAYSDGDSANLADGDVIYLDDFSATISGSTLSYIKNTLEGVSVATEDGKVIVSAPNGSEYTVYTITGAEVVNESLTTGVYIVKVEKDNKIYTTKVIVE